MATLILCYRPGVKVRLKRELKIRPDCRCLNFFGFTSMSLESVVAFDGHVWGAVPLVTVLAGAIFAAARRGVVPQGGKDGGVNWGQLGSTWSEP